MLKLLLLFALLFLMIASGAQPLSLYYKKGLRSIERYYPGSSFTFRGLDGEWHQGEIMGIAADTIFFRTVIVRYYTMGTDTLRGAIQAIPLPFITGMPKEGIRVQYLGGSFTRNRRSGQRILGWLRNGQILRIGGGGYAALYTINGGLSQQGPVWETHKPLILAGGIFTAGMLMLIRQRDWHPIGGRFHFVIQ